MVSPRGIEPATRGHKKKQKASRVQGRHAHLARSQHIYRPLINPAWSTAHPHHHLCTRNRTSQFQVTGLYYPVYYPPYILGRAQPRSPPLSILNQYVVELYLHQALGVVGDNNTKSTHKHKHKPKLQHTACVLVNHARAPLLPPTCLPRRRSRSRRPATTPARPP